MEIEVNLSRRTGKFGGMCGTWNRRDLEPGDYYTSEEGYIVFTESYHLKRGYCCKSGCKHCPYGYNRKTGNIDRK